MSLLADLALLEPVERAWDRAARGYGRPTIPMTVFVRLMVVKQRSGWGYETLVREVSDSLHLRRFCHVALTERVPDESTVRKLVRRLGAEVIDEICRVVITKATTGERRFVARAARIDSTVLEADVRYPTDIGLAADATAALAREATASAAGRTARPQPLAGDRAARAQTQPDAGSAHRPGQADRAAVDRRGRRVGRALGPRGAPACRAPACSGPRARRPTQAGCSEALGAARRPRRHGRPPDSPAAGGREDHRPVGLHERPRRPADPQGQATSADRVRLRRPTRRALREHPPRRPRSDRPRRQPDRLPQ